MFDGGVADGLLVGEIARLAGVTVKAVRHYHRHGLLPEPPRLSNGYRIYSPEHLVALVRIRKLREAGVSLAAIGSLLSRPGPDEALRQLKELLSDLEAEREQLDLRLRALRVLVDSLGRGDTLEGSDDSPPSFAKAEESLVALGASPRLLHAERRIWALLDSVSWSRTTQGAIRDGFAAMMAGGDTARRVAVRLDEILREVEAGAAAADLVPLVQRLVEDFPDRVGRAGVGGAEQQAMSALAMQSLPPPLAEALRLVARGDTA